VRRLYEVRVREQVGPGKWVKKSKFYWEKSSGDAAKKYRGSGAVMWVEKAPKEKLLKVGGFFDLGNLLLENYTEESLLDKVAKKKERRGYHGNRQTKGTDRPKRP